MAIAGLDNASRVDAWCLALGFLAADLMRHHSSIFAVVLQITLQVHHHIGGGTEVLHHGVGIADLGQLLAHLAEIGRLVVAQFDLAAAEIRNVLLRLPRFEARFDASVKNALIAAGMPCAFAEACADFAGMANAPLKIDDVAHATFLRVDEEGTEAAAVTAVTIVVTGSRIVPDVPQMIVDRPFLVTIRDRASGALIFFGRIADPVAVEKSQ